jgi:superfamily II DNA/RNA helicase
MRIAILGTRGIPNFYGGFEQFAQYLSEDLVKKDHEVYVYNSHTHPYQKSEWNGVNIIHCKDPENIIGTAGQFIYDLNCILDSRKRNFDVILQLGYATTSIWFWLLPKKAVVITNMDGLEWRRSRGLAIVFCRTKRNAQKLTDDLADRGFAVGTVHGDLGQGAREQALRAFRSGKIDVLVATDVAARGIDVDGVTHVFNYTCPEDEKTYLHRIGRTGRAGNSGVSVTLVDWDDVPRWGLINKALGLAFPDPIETYSTSQHVYTGLGIPKGTTGRLPKASRTRAGLDAETIEDLGETGAAAGRRSSGQGGRGGSSNGRGSDSRRSGSSSGGNSRNESGGSRSSDSGPGGSRTADADKATKPKRKRNRNRSRTRSGKPVSGNQAADNADAKATT